MSFYPKVSVILPCYNHAEFISCAIESVLNQTYNNIEFIIADNGSTDNSLELINKYSKKIARIIHMENNNLPRCFQTLFDYSTGDYIAIMTSDDYWESDKIQLQVEEFEKNPNIIACFTESIHCDNTLTPINNASNTPNKNRYEWFRSLLEEGNTLTMPSAMITREAYKQYIRSFGWPYRQIPDLSWWLQIVMHGDIRVVPSPLLKLRWHGDGPNRNESFPTKEVNIRLSYEQIDLRTNVLSEVSDSYFAEAFRDTMINPTASSHSDILCEKLLYMLRHKNDSIWESAAIYFFYRHSFEILDALETNYNINFMSFHDLISTRGVYFDLAENAKQTSKAIKELKQIINDSINICNRRENTIKYLQKNINFLGKNQSPGFTEINRELKYFSQKSYICPDAFSSDKPLALVVTHTLISGGAPLVLLEMMKSIKKRYDIIVISLEDGNLGETFAKEGFNVYVGTFSDFSLCNKQILQAFDLVFLNTIVSFPIAELYQNTKIPVLWWIHEPDILIHACLNIMDSLAHLSNNFKLLSVTNLTMESLQRFYNVDSAILHMGIEDKYSYKESNNKKTVFFIPSAFNSIKGTDIIANAIVNLPESYKLKSLFYFAGSPNQPGYYELLQKIETSYPETIILLGQLSKNKVYEIMQESDCILAPSRHDATPTTIVEGMMFSKLTLCSTGCGISKYITDGTDGLIFPSENIDALVAKLEWIIDNSNTSVIKSIGNAGRKIYLSQFEQSMIESSLFNMLDQHIEFITNLNTTIQYIPNKLSVVLDCNSDIKNISACVNSIITELSEVNYELLLINTQCSEEISQILKNFEKQHEEHILLLNFDEPISSNKARNISLEYITGEFVLFMNSSCELNPSVLYQAMIGSPDADLLIFNSVHQPFGDIGEIQSLADRKTLILNSISLLSSNNCLYRLPFIKNYGIIFPEDNICWDYMFNILSCMYASKVNYYECSLLKSLDPPIKSIKDAENLLVVEENIIEILKSNSLITNEMYPFKEELSYSFTYNIIVNLYDLSKDISGMKSFLLNILVKLYKLFPDLLKNSYFESDSGTRLSNILKEIL